MLHQITMAQQIDADHIIDMSVEDQDTIQSLPDHATINSLEIQSVANDLEISNTPDMSQAVSYIYKVPSRLRALNAEKYEPCIVSIGPFHRGMKYLTITEEHKKLYLGSIMKRSAQVTEDDIKNAVRKIEANARVCYAERIDLNQEEFVTMMILDGCFILELFYKCREYLEKKQENRDSFYAEDHIFGAFWKVRTLHRDLVLLENQIPFIVLKTLFCLTKDKNCNWTLNKLAFNFLDSELPCKLLPDVERDNKITGHHLLDLIRNRLLDGYKQKNYGEFPSWTFIQHAASDLSELGVRFKKKKSGPINMFDITFNESGVLEIPHFFYGEGVTILLPNLIALEQCHRQYPDQIASYAIFLDTLINSKEDVKLLRQKGIIDVYWYEDEKIAIEINSLGKGLNIDAFYYDDLCVRVTKFRCKKMHQWKANLKHHHFQTPWKGISVFAAVVLIGLSATQTVYSVLSYYK